MRKISANNRQKVLKLCTCTAMKKVYSTVHSMLLPWRSLGVRSLPFVKQNSFISSLSNNVYCSAQIRKFIYTQIMYFGGFNHLILQERDRNLVFSFLIRRLQFPNGILGNNIRYIVACTFFIAIHVQSFNTFYPLFAEIFLFL